MGKQKGNKKSSNVWEERARTASQRPFAGELDTIRQALGELVGGPSPKSKRRIMELLEGPDARLIVEADKAVNDDILMGGVAGDMADMVSLRLQLGGDAKSKVIRDMGPFDLPLIHFVIANNAIDCLQAVLAAGADPNVTTQESKFTPLHFLVAALSTAVLHQGARLGKRLPVLATRMAEMLRDAGADISAWDSKKNCPITSAISGGYLPAATMLIQVFSAPGPHCQIAKMDLPRYLEYSMTVEAVEIARWRAWNPDAAAYAAYSDAITAAWKASESAALDDQSKARQAEKVATLLEKAVVRGANRTIGLLCSGVEAHVLRSRSERGRVPLIHFALQHDSHGVIEALHSAGVDVTERDQQGLNVLYCACIERRLKFLHTLCDKLDRETLTTLMSHRDPKEGITAFGYAVAWGYAREADIMLLGCLFNRIYFSELLDRHKDVSQHHLPLFSAIVHGHHNILRMLLDAYMDLETPACVEHIEKHAQGNGEALYLRQPKPSSESMTLLMCAATQNDLFPLKLLLKAGADPRQAVSGRDALHAVLDRLVNGEEVRKVFKYNKDLFRNPSRNGMKELQSAVKDSLVLEVATCFECLLFLIWYGAGMSLSDSWAVWDFLKLYHGQCIECQALTALMFKRVRMCSSCKLFGRWQRCMCGQAWYCGKECQRQHWLQHKPHCSQAKPSRRRKC